MVNMYNITMTLSIYSRDFDDNQNVCNGGLSGKVFLDGKGGREFCSLSDALEYVRETNAKVEGVVIFYRDGDEQRYVSYRDCPVV